MKKQKDDMQVNVAAMRRNLKNIAHNYTDAQVKVREATSNDPWGPSATIMAEIADLTYNVVAFSEIMQMIWKRLNDHGKNWRHVYKALILLEYLIKTGTEKVAQQCKENIFAIQTLKEFVHLEEGKDQGLHVREKAKQLVSLLRDDERLKNERTKALKAKERFAQHPSGFGSDGYIESRSTPVGWQDSEPKPASEIEFVRPQTAGEEELQLQLAMAMSREEAEQEEAKRRSDDVRLQLALSQSEQDFKRQQDKKPDGKGKQSHLMDLLDISLGATSLSSPVAGAGAISDPWGTPVHASAQSDPWSRTSSPPVDPWQAPPRPNVSVGGSLASANEPWLPHRTQSPSVASGSSTEGWLQNNSTPTSALNGNVSSAISSDPWLPKPASVPLTTSTPPVDPWLVVDPSQNAPIPVDPWRPKSTTTVSTSNDPWEAPITKESRPSPLGAVTSPMSDIDDFDIITNRNKSGHPIKDTNGTNNNNSSLLDDMDPLSSKRQLKTPQSFLGENSSLVNLDNLIKPITTNNVSSAAPYNPFSDTLSSTLPPAKTNLFNQPTQNVPSINQMKQQPFPVTLNQDPWTPVNSNQSSTTHPTVEAWTLK
uniref:Putative equilibrative nucleoside transporter protein n=1 Tax=Tabanus bromius TaxID=304241 RepID=A0A0K8TPB8_TABBR